MQECEPTVCVEFNSKIVQVNGKRIKLQIWDTSGQDRFRYLIRDKIKGERVREKGCIDTGERHNF